MRRAAISQTPYISVPVNTTLWARPYISRQILIWAACTKTADGRGLDLDPYRRQFPYGHKILIRKVKPENVQTIESFFNGVLDGGGHKIENLYCNRYTDKDFGNSMAIGLWVV